MSLECVYLFLTILDGILYGISTIVCEGSLKVFFEHASQVVFTFIIARLSFHVPGLYSCLFYYLAMYMIYNKIVAAYADYQLHPGGCHNQIYKYMFYFFLLVVLPAGLCLGFYEKLHRSYIPNAAIIDLLALGCALRCKPDVIRYILEFYEIDEVDPSYSDINERNFNWFERGVTLFACARNVGMMVYCSGIIKALFKATGGAPRPNLGKCF